MVIRRIKDRWHNSTPRNTERDVLGEKTLDDQASALAFILWRQGLNGAINLHAEDFRYDDDQQRVGVISEFLAFQIQHVDRITHAFLSQSKRQSLLEALCGKVADLMQDNLADIAGPGQYRSPFIALLNRRFSDYAEFTYGDAELSNDYASPGYECRRYLGHQVLDIMGEDQTNRWVIDQIMDIDSVKMIAQVTTSTHRLFGSSDK